MQGWTRQDHSPSTCPTDLHLAQPGFKQPACVRVCMRAEEGVAEGNTKNRENELKSVLPTSKLILILWVTWDQAGFSHPPALPRAA